MNCPKCGKENPDGAQICISCGQVLKNDTSEKPAAKPKTSKLAIASFILSFLSLFLCFLAGIPSIILGIISIVQIGKSRGKLKGNPFAVAAIVISILLMSAVFLWSLDAPSIPNDYTIADLRSAPAECEQSYELLKKLADENDLSPDAPAIGLSQQDINNLDEIKKIFKEDRYENIYAKLTANAENILCIWQNAQKGRDIINQFNTFPEIADLTKPYMTEFLNFFPNFRRLILLHRDFVCLQSCQGNEEVALNVLLKSDDVVRKLDVNARSFITKLVYIACFSVHIETANFIINNPKTSEDSLKLLAEHFQPLTNEDTSLRNSMIFEYLTFKNMLINIDKKSKNPFLKLNSTLRLYKNFWDYRIAAEKGRKEIEKLSVWPSIYPDVAGQIDPNGNTPWYYKAYNPVGSLYLAILMPAFDRIFQINTKLQIHYDLLQIVLNKRLGREVNLKARAYSDEYIVDLENKKIFSPGPDGIPHTKDDIKLMINPEVLNFKK